MKFESLKDEYARLVESMVIRSSFKGALGSSAKTILAGKERYQKVSELTGVPWFVIGLIHQMEAGCKWGRHLHNGDPLSARTVCVPANRPAKGNAPFTWEASACDAVMMKNMHKVKDWSIERIAYELERYNGWGYRNYHKAVLTPYLWSGTTHYARGKYVADREWSATAVSGQTGAMPLLKTLMVLDPSIGFEPVEEVKPEPQETEPESFRKADEWQWPTWVTSTLKIATGVGAGGVAVSDKPQQLIPSPPSVEAVTQWQNTAETLNNFAHSPAVWIAVCGILIAVVAPWMARKLA